MRLEVEDLMLGKFISWHGNREEILDGRFPPVAYGINAIQLRLFP